MCISFFTQGMHFSYSQGGKLDHCKTRETMDVAEPGKSSKLQRSKIDLRNPITGSWWCCSLRVCLPWLSNSSGYWEGWLSFVNVAQGHTQKLLYGPFQHTYVSSLQFCILIVTLAGSFTREAKLSEHGQQFFTLLFSWEHLLISGHKTALNFGLRCDHKLDRCLLVKNLVHIAHTVLVHRCWMSYRDSLGSCELHQMLH